MTATLEVAVLLFPSRNPVQAQQMVELGTVFADGGMDNGCMQGCKSFQICHVSQLTGHNGV
jgi:hypothetical protein